MNAGSIMKACENGQMVAEFRGVTPAQRDQLQAQGSKFTVSESPWLSNLMVVFNTQRPPFNDARVRRALSLAIDRWGAAQQLQGSTFLKYVGGLMRPGSNLAMPEAELVMLPGFSHDITASRAEAKRLLAEAGVHGLTVNLLVRDIPIPHYGGAQLFTATLEGSGNN